MTDNEHRAEPQTKVEQLLDDFGRGEITEEECRDRVQQHVCRPLDIDMLRGFCRGYEERLVTFGSMLQSVIRIATDQHGGELWRKLEPEVDAAVERMDAKLPLFTEELETVLLFLTDLRAVKGEPVRCGSFTGDSAHWIAGIVLSQASQGWKNCKQTADRSRTDPRYLYAATASSLFYQVWIEPGKLPKPNDLAALMRLERAAAERALRDQAEPKPVTGTHIETGTIEIKTGVVNVNSPPHTVEFTDPIQNVDLAKLVGLADAYRMSTQIREALTASNKAKPKGGAGKNQAWSHAQLRKAYPNLPDGKLKAFLKKHLIDAGLTQV